jgi:hypothetical protein
MKAHVYKATEPDRCPAEMPIRASIECPWTGEILITCGDTASGALYALGKALTAQQKLHPDDVRALNFEIEIDPDVG